MFDTTNLTVVARFRRRKVVRLTRIIAAVTINCFDISPDDKQSQKQNLSIFIHYILFGAGGALYDLQMQFCLTANETYAIENLTEMIYICVDVVLVPLGIYVVVSRKIVQLFISQTTTKPNLTRSLSLSLSRVHMYPTHPGFELRARTRRTTKQVTTAHSTSTPPTTPSATPRASIALPLLLPSLLPSTLVILLLLLLSLVASTVDFGFEPSVGAGDGVNNDGDGVNSDGDGVNSDGDGVNSDGGDAPPG
jgi:hypothetical protein